MQTQALKTRAHISFSHLWFIHNSTQQRLASGYTQQELNFLLGLPDDYVQLAESFAFVPHKLVEQLGLAAQIFGCAIDKLFTADLTEEAELGIDYQLFEHEGRLWHEAWGWKDDGVSLLYKFSEPVAVRVANHDIEHVTAMLNTLVARGWFGFERDAWEVFTELRRCIGHRVQAEWVRRALGVLVKQNGLERVADEEGNWVYIGAVRSNNR